MLLKAVPTGLNLTVGKDFGETTASLSQRTDGGQAETIINALDTYNAKYSSNRNDYKVIESVTETSIYETLDRTDSQGNAHYNPTYNIGSSNTYTAIDLDLTRSGRYYLMRHTAGSGVFTDYDTLDSSGDPVFRNYRKDLSGAKTIDRTDLSNVIPSDSVLYNEKIIDAAQADQVYRITSDTQYYRDLRGMFISNDEKDLYITGATETGAAWNGDFGKTTAASGNDEFREFWNHYYQTDSEGEPVSPSAEETKYARKGNTIVIENGGSDVALTNKVYGGYDNQDSSVADADKVVTDNAIIITENITGKAVIIDGYSETGEVDGSVDSDYDDTNAGESSGRKDGKVYIKKTFASDGTEVEVEDNQTITVSAGKDVSAATLIGGQTATGKVTSAYIALGDSTGGATAGDVIVADITGNADVSQTIGTINVFDYGVIGAHVKVGTNGKITKNLTGVRTDTADVEDKTLVVDSSNLTDEGTIRAAWANDGSNDTAANVKNNTIELKNAAQAGKTSDTSGGIIAAQNGTGTAEGNKATVTGGNVTNVTGAKTTGATGGDATKNAVTITSTASVKPVITGDVIGAETNAGAAGASGAANTVTVTGDSSNRIDISGNIYDAKSVSGDVTYNTVALKNTNVSNANKNVYGGYTGGDNANYNEVTLNEGAAVSGNVYGGYSAATASNNTITIGSGITATTQTVPTVAKNVYAGYAATETKNNTVDFYAGTVTGTVYGGNKTTVANRQTDANKLNAYVNADAAIQRTADSIDGLGIVNFDFASGTQANLDAIKGGTASGSPYNGNAGLILTSATVADTDLTNVKVTIDGSDYEPQITSGGTTTGNPTGLTPKTKYYLIHKEAGEFTNYKDMVNYAYGTEDRTTADGEIMINAYQVDQVYRIFSDSVYTRDMGGMYIDKNKQNLYITGADEVKETWTDSTFGKKTNTDATGETETNKYEKFKDDTNKKYAREGNTVIIQPEDPASTAAVNLGSKKVYGGYDDTSDGKGATDNTIVIMNDLAGDAEIIGVYSESGEANGTVAGDVIRVSGWTDPADADKNKLTRSNTIQVKGVDVSAATLIGGQTATGKVTNVTIALEDGSKAGDVIAADVTGAADVSQTIGTINASSSGQVKVGDNVTITNLTGVRTNTAAISDKKLTVNESTLKVSDTVRAAYSTGGGAVSGNEATLTDGTVKTLIGAETAGNGAATGTNKAAVTGSTVTDVIGAKTDAGDATGANKATVTGGTVTGNAIGAQTETGKVSGASAEISDATVANVYGGKVNGGTKSAESNTVTLNANANITGNVYGGYSANGEAKNNVVTLAMGCSSKVTGKVSGNVYGGAGTSTSGNEIHFQSGEVTGTIYGGYVNEAGEQSDNTLYVEDTKLKAGNVSGVKKIDYVLNNDKIKSTADNTANAALILTKSEATDLGGVSIQINGDQYPGITDYSYLETGKKYYLISKTNGTLTNYADASDATKRLANYDEIKGGGNKTAAGDTVIVADQIDQIYKIFSSTVYTRDMAGMYVTQDERSLYLTGLSEVKETWADDDFGKKIGTTGETETTKYKKFNEEQYARQGNTVIIQPEDPASTAAVDLGSKTVYGGYDDTTDGKGAENNTVIVENDVTGTGTIIGVYSANGEASGEITTATATSVSGTVNRTAAVEVKSGKTVKVKEIIGGQTETGSVDKVTVKLNAGTDDTHKTTVSGNITVAKASGTGGKVTNANKIELNDNVKIDGNLTLAQTNDSPISSNAGNAQTLTIDKAVTVTGVVTAADSESGEVSGNTLTISDKDAKVNIVYGARSVKGAATENEVNITDGTVLGNVIGGSSDEVAAESNKVTINGGSTVSVGWNVMGGSSDGEANKNEVVIANAEIGRNVYGGYGTKTTGNTVNYNAGDSEVVGTIYGGSDATDVTGNTLNVNANQRKAGNVANFETINFNYDVKTDSVGNSGNAGLLLTERSGTTDLTNVTIKIQNSDYVPGSSPSGLEARKKYYLIHTTAGTELKHDDPQGELADGGKIVKAAQTDQVYRILDKDTYTRDMAGMFISKDTDNNYDLYITGSDEIEQKWTSSEFGKSGETGLYENYKGAAYMASGNTVFVEGDANGKTVYGGYASGTDGSSKNATENAVVVRADSKGTVIGAYSASGNVDGSVNRTVDIIGTDETGVSITNTVEVAENVKVTGDVVGGSTKGADGDVKNVTVKLNSGSEVAGGVYGGFGGGEISDNKVILDNAKVTATSGSASNDGLVVANQSSGGNITNTDDSIVNVTMKGGSAKNVYGGYVSGTTAADISKMKVELSDGAAVSAGVYGAYTDGTGNLTENTVDINGATAKNVYGAYGTTGTATENTVTIQGAASVSESVIGALTTTGAAGSENKANTVEIKDGASVTGNVYGAQATSSGTAAYNEVTLTDSNVGGNVYGGSSGSGAATDNKVTLAMGDGNKVGGDVYGGKGTTTTDNTVTFNSGRVVGMIYGSSVNGTSGNNYSEVSGNLLEVGDIQLQAGNIANFATIDFQGGVTQSTTPSQASLLLDKEAVTDLTGVTAYLINGEKYSPLNNPDMTGVDKGTKYYLINTAGNGTLEHDNPQGELADGGKIIEALQTDQVYRILDKDTYTRDMAGMFIDADKKNLYITGNDEIQQKWTDNAFGAPNGTEVAEPANMRTSTRMRRRQAATQS